MMFNTTRTSFSVHPCSPAHPSSPPPSTPPTQTRDTGGGAEHPHAQRRAASPSRATFVRQAGREVQRRRDDRPPAPHRTGLSLQSVTTCNPPEGTLDRAVRRAARRRRPNGEGLRVAATEPF